MNSIETKGLRSHDDVLRAIAEAIDIPDHMGKLARERYESLGKWLDREESAIRKYEPEIFPQGSFLLGTAIRPIGDADEYDIDLVCRLNATKHDFTMKSLKDAVGKEIREYATKNGMSEPENGRRCWTLPYAKSGTKGNFHMDILPSLTDEAGYEKIVQNALLETKSDADPSLYKSVLDHAIAITDREHNHYSVPSNDWPISNPIGYGIWFHSQSHQQLAESVLELVRPVPIHKSKTTLQLAIQLLKRHRDGMFKGDENKPISIIITTLAAHAYSGEQKLDDAIRSILKNMHKFIVKNQGKPWVPNPVNPTENFADKWSESPQKEENFYSWLERAQHDFGLYSSNAYGDIPHELKSALSESTISRVAPSISLPTPSVISPTDVGAAEVENVRREGRDTKPWCR